MTYRRVALILLLLLAAAGGLTVMSSWPLFRATDARNESLYLRARTSDIYSIVELDTECQIQTPDQFRAAWMAKIRPSPVSGASIRVNPDVELWRDPERSLNEIATISIIPSRRRQLAVTIGLKVVEVENSDMPSWAH